MLVNCFPAVFAPFMILPIHSLQTWLCWSLQVTINFAAAFWSSCTWGPAGWPGSRRPDGDGRVGALHLWWGTGPLAQPAYQALPLSDPGWLLCARQRVEALAAAWSPVYVTTAAAFISGGATLGYFWHKSWVETYQVSVLQMGSSQEHPLIWIENTVLWFCLSCIYQLS